MSNISRTPDPFLVEVLTGLASTCVLGHATPMAIAADVSLHLIVHPLLERLLYITHGRAWMRFMVRAIGLAIVALASLFF